MVMNKVVLYGSVSVFSLLGSWIPSLWHAGYLSIWGILGGIVGFFVGLWVYSLLNDYIDS